MEPSLELKRPFRSKFRSIKYSVLNPPVHQSSDPKQEPQHRRSKSIINIKKLRSVSNYKTADQQDNFTIDTTAKKDSYIQTFFNLMTRSPINFAQENKQNEELQILMPNYHAFFNKETSQFTFLDKMAKPLKYIETNLNATSKELNTQQKTIDLLRYELKTLKNVVQRSLADIEQSTHAKIIEIRQAFQNNEVLENERKLRHRKQLRLLQRAQNSSSYLCELLCDRVVQVQKKIFSCQPYKFFTGLPFQNLQPDV